MASRGICYVAIGRKAEEEYKASLTSLQNKYEWNVALSGFCTLFTDDPVKQSRYVKTRVYDWSRYDQTMYVDADTRFRTDPEFGFRLLDAGYDLVIAPSIRQTSDWLWKVSAEERIYTAEHLLPMASLQGGMFWFGRNKQTERFFAAWHEEWLRFKGQDQAALLRALNREPLAVWLVSQERFIDHLWGHARHG